MAESTTLKTTIRMTAERVGQLAQFAGLPLADERHAPVAAILDDWLGAANELSEKMSRPEYQALVPAVVFVHADSSEQEG